MESFILVGISVQLGFICYYLNELVELKKKELKDE